MAQIVAHFAIVEQEVNVFAKGVWRLALNSQQINVSCFNLHFFCDGGEGFVLEIDADGQG
jgi:hypothetical protein